MLWVLPIDAELWYSSCIEPNASEITRSFYGRLGDIMRNISIQTDVINGKFSIILSPFAHTYNRARSIMKLITLLS